MSCYDSLENIWRLDKMGRKSKELSLEIKQLIVDLKENGHKVSDISRILDIPESTCKSILKVFHQRGSVERADRSGRPRKVSRRGEVRLGEKQLKSDSIKSRTELLIFIIINLTLRFCCYLGCLHVKQNFIV